jgi:Ion transport protein
MAEAYLKIRAYAFRYFDTLSNKFDAFIVISSIMDILMTLTMKNVSESFSLGPQLARMMRVMRVTRIVRLASRNEGLQALM